MIVDLLVPPLSESVSEATVSTWHKQVGEAVLQDENLADLETDKVMLESPAPQAGVLIEQCVPEGAVVATGQIIARLDTEALATVKREARPLAAEKPASPAPIVMPSAQKILAEKGVAIDTLRGTGLGGRITKEDALLAKPAEKVTPKAIPQTPEPPQTPTKTTPRPQLAPAPSVELPFDDRPEERVPMSRLRTRIAERLLESQSQNAILTTFNEINMSAVIALRKTYGEAFEKAHGVRLGFMGFFVKAVTAALQKYPILNASVDRNDIVYHGYIDIGVAVSAPRGLVVPILRNVEDMSLADIEKGIAQFAQKAKEGRLSLEDLTGGTFSISNGGVFGSMLSTPIINPPQSAILGIHATQERPIAENGQVVIRPMNYFALSYDHRIIDGREAVLGLVTIKEALEDPRRLLLDI